MNNAGDPPKQKEVEYYVLQLRALPRRNIRSGDIQIFSREPLKTCHLSGS